jgi:hypothetical protein
MAVITMTFAKNIQDSVQVGDMIYVCIYNSSDGTVGSPVELGTCTAVTSTTLSCNIPTGTTRPTTNDFIMFSKDNAGNISALDGYYAEIELKNDATTAVELFAVGSEIFESSK